MTDFLDIEDIYIINNYFFSKKMELTVFTYSIVDIININVSKIDDYWYTRTCKIDIVII